MTDDINDKTTSPPQSTDKSSAPKEPFKLEIGPRSPGERVLLFVVGTAMAVVFISAAKVMI